MQFHNQMIEEEDIAVIGMSGRFPDANNLEEFWTNLINGKHSIKKLPEDRIHELKLMFGNKTVNDFINEGYLDNILQFEPEIFNISCEEAKYIDPQQRLLLELVEETILDAGYNPGQLPTKSVGVFIAENENQYSNIFQDSTAFSNVNNVNASNAGRVAYTFDFHGPVLSIGTACSSSLVAVHIACQNILLREIEYAIVGGVRMMFLPPREGQVKDNPLVSESRLVRAFDANADGTIGGEGGGVLLLKQAKEALKDGDVIHAIIKGSAVNNDGFRSNGMNAPSEDGQAEVISKAFEKSRIEPLSISYIETHGTGTKIGDPIEIAGISQSLKKLGYANQSIPIGSLKSNIGHLDVASGIASMIKTILILKEGKIPASINYKKANPLIDFEKSPVYVNTQLRDWNLVEPKRAGVSSLSFIGTNAHIILENVPKRRSQVDDKPSKEKLELLVFSARTKKSLTENMLKLKHYIQRNPDINISDIAYTLNAGRRTFNYKVILSACSTKDLLDKLNRNEYKIINVNNKIELSPIFVIPDFLTDEFTIPIPMEDERVGKYLQELYQEWGDTDNIPAHIFACLAYFSYFNDILQRYGVKPKTYLGFGSGYHLAELFNGEISLQECIHKIVDYIPINKQLETNRLKELYQSIIDYGVNLFVFINPSRKLELESSRLLSSIDNISMWSVEENDGHFYDGLKSLVKQGLVINWGKVYKGQNRLRLSLPTYHFDRKPYYLSKTINNTNNNTWFVDTLEEERVINNEKEIKERITNLISNISLDKELNLNSNLLDAGINSIMIIHFIGKVKDEYGVNIPIELFFEEKTVNELIKSIVGIILNTSTQEEITIMGKNDNQNYVASSSQQRLFILHDMIENNTSYNMSFAMSLDGEIDKNLFQKVMREVVDRHESLRTSFEIGKEEQLIQKVHHHVDLDIKYVKLEKGKNVNKLINENIKPFNLFKPPLFRTMLIEDQGTYLWFFDIHHIISDGTSMEIFLKEFIDLYNGRTLKPLRLQYKDFVKYQLEFFNSDKFKEMELIWLHQFKGTLPILDLPTDFERPKYFKFEGNTIEFNINERLISRIKEVSKQNGVTLYMTLLAVYKILLSKYANQEDIIVGTFTSGRTNVDLEKVFGMLVNTLPIRTQPISYKTFTNYLQEVKNVVIQALENQEYPFEMLIEKLNIPWNPSRNPLFSSSFVLQNSLHNFNSSEVKSEKINLSPYRITTSSTQFDIQLEAIEIKDSIVLRLHYATNLFKEEKMEQLLQYYEKLLEYISSDSSIRIMDMEIETQRDVYHLRQKHFENTFEFDI